MNKKVGILFIVSTFFLGLAWGQDSQEGGILEKSWMTGVAWGLGEEMELELSETKIFVDDLSLHGYKIKLENSFSLRVEKYKIFNYALSTKDKPYLGIGGEIVLTERKDIEGEKPYEDDLLPYLGYVNVGVFHSLNSTSGMLVYGGFGFGDWANQKEALNVKSDTSIGLLLQGGVSVLFDNFFADLKYRSVSAKLETEAPGFYKVEGDLSLSSFLLSAGLLW